MSGYHQFCGLAVALDTVGDRWNLLIVRELLIGPRRFSQLRAALPGAASNLLTARLRALVEAGLIIRNHDPSRKAVEYSLTATGEGLRESVHALIRWGAQFMGAGPRPGDAVRADLIGLAAEALLEGRHVVAVDHEASENGRVALTLGSEQGNAAPARIEGPAGAVLGAIAGVLPPSRATALGVAIDDRDEILASLAPPRP